MQTVKIADGIYLVREQELKRGIDATPDGRYALRILQAYLEDCECYLSDNTEGKSPKNKLLIAMNEANEARRKELQRAILKLKHT